MGRGRGIIVGRKCPRIQRCPWCGRMRGNHPDGLYVCPVPVEVVEALRRFARANGRTWRAKLSRVWEGACAAINDPDE